MTCEVFKVLLSVLGILADGSRQAVFKGWTLQGSVLAALVPAAIYALQNTLIQVAYRHLDDVTFTLLNQTKLIFTALCNYAFLGRRQSSRQIAALFVLLVAAIMLALDSTSPPSSSSAAKASSAHNTADAFFLGIVPMLFAAVTSGAGSTYCQWLLQVKGHNPNLLTIEMCSLSFVLLLLSLSSSSDGASIRTLGFFHAWTPLSTLPPLANAVGGILVGLVTKYAGGVRKGFSVIFGLIVAALLQMLVEGTALPLHVLVALPLVLSSTYVHARFPYVIRKTRTE